MSGSLPRRLAALEARRASAPSYVVELSAEEQADPAAIAAAVAEHQRRTGWPGPFILAPAEVSAEEWEAAQKEA